MDILKKIRQKLKDNTEDQADIKNGRRRFIRNFGIGVASAAAATPVMAVSSGKVEDKYTGRWDDSGKWKWNESGTRKWNDIVGKEHVSIDGHSHYDIHSTAGHSHFDVVEHEHDSYVKMDSLGFIDIGGIIFNDGTMQDTAFPSPIGNTNRIIYSDGLEATWKDADLFGGNPVIYSGSAPSDPKKHPLWFDTSNKKLNFYDGENWVELYAESTPIEASGGSKSNKDRYTIHTFSGSSRVLELRITGGEGNIEIEAWGAGGGASGRHGNYHGGGGGCVKVQRLPVKKGDNIMIGIGAGGKRAAGHCYRGGTTSGGKNPLGDGHGGDGGGAGHGGCSVAGSSGGASTIVQLNGTEVIFAAGGGGAGGAESCGNPGSGGGAGQDGNNCYAQRWRGNSYGTGGKAGGMSGHNGGNKPTASGDQSGSGGGGGGYRGGNHGNDVHYDCWGQPGGGGGTSKHLGPGTGKVYNASGKTPGNSSGRPGVYGNGGDYGNGSSGYVVIKYLTEGA